jgi:hypothetical protein
MPNAPFSFLRILLLLESGFEVLGNIEPIPLLRNLSNNLGNASNPLENPGSPYDSGLITLSYLVSSSVNPIGCPPSPTDPFEYTTLSYATEILFALNPLPSADSTSP